MSFNSFYKQLIALFITFILIPVLFIPTFSTNISGNINSDSQIISNFRLNNNGYIWPTPGYTRITSYFGKRKSPTKYASSFHQGIDISAPAGTNLVAICDAVVTYIGFNGSAGYSIHLKFNNLHFFYHHVDPNYIVKLNDFVKAGQLIGKVGPKNVYGIKNNPYKDSQGRPTNGATTGPHLHFTIKKRRHSRQSFKLFLITYRLHCPLRCNHAHNDDNHVHIHVLHSNLTQFHGYIQDI